MEPQWYFRYSPDGCGPLGLVAVVALHHVEHLTRILRHVAQPDFSSAVLAERGAPGLHIPGISSRGLRSG